MNKKEKEKNITNKIVSYIERLKAGYNKKQEVKWLK